MGPAYSPARDHEKLVQELYRQRDEHGWEVNVVLMEKISRAEQIQLAVRTTIMMGVHGNGLTNLIWMRPRRARRSWSSFIPVVSRMIMSTPHVHSVSPTMGSWETSSASLSLSDVADHHLGLSPVQTFPLNAYPEGFQGSSIPIDAATVGRLVYDRLTLSLEVDD
ncbi:hypothetical protein MSAN_01827100 [Mycena sanguinolenta]|uniref:Glycosyltransferase 61 catalytic domain-containing protein n=1 Tax=Mycena sanguinolenta TaxID=230812 RepID=A0A8H6XT86_9AGAR|nr:hypothetical protein MSAN_01827100 [Mycena sanguinolenta]